MTCLYNGVPLPALPTVRHCDHLGRNMDYVAITKNENGDFSAHFLPCPLMLKPTANVYGLAGSRDSGLTEYCYVIYKCENGEWVEIIDQNDGFVALHSEVGTSYTLVLDAENIIWANHDIFYEDGSLARAGSVPVPQLNPAALMQGFATMLSLRRNRT